MVLIIECKAAVAGGSGHILVLLHTGWEVFLRAEPDRLQVSVCAEDLLREAAGRQQPVVGWGRRGAAVRAGIAASRVLHCCCGGRRAFQHVAVLVGRRCAELVRAATLDS